MILDLFRRHRGLALFTVLNYLDKAFAVVVPILVLWTTKNQTLYNQVEYIYSIGALLMIVSELGVHNYLLFGYRGASDREQFLVDGNNHYMLLTLIYSVASILVAILLIVTRQGSPVLWLLVVTRTLYNGLFTFHSVLARLKDRPSAVFAISLGANAGTCFFIMLFWRLSFHLTLPIVFLTQGLLVAGVVIIALRCKLWQNLRPLLNYLWKTLAYAWPIIINVFLVVVVQNIGKLYAQNALSPNDMTRISMVQRIALVVQLGHASAAGYLAKSLFLTPGLRIERGIMVLYSGVLGVGVLLSYITAYLASHFLFRSLSLGDPLLSLMLIYTVMWCYSAFFEQYLNKANKNELIPIITIISALIFALITYTFKAQGLIGIAYGMVANAAVGLALMLIAITRAMREAHYD